MSAEDFLFELGTEELPPTSLKTLAEALLQNFCELLKKGHIVFNTEAVRWFATPRRLALWIPDLAKVQLDRDECVDGPPLKACWAADGSPTAALLGFARKQGVPLEQLQKGTERIQLKRSIPGKPTSTLLPLLLEQALSDLPIAKRMRWGARREEFVRPVHSVLIMHGAELIPCCLLGICSQKAVSGHRFMAPGPWTLEHAKDYIDTLRSTQVIADFAERRALIIEQVRKLEEKFQARAIMPDDLLDEVTALVEWPVALTGCFDPSFLSVPQEALISTMQGNQKYFPLTDAHGQLLPQFIFISNIQSPDPEWIIAGNERVVRPRLSDAAFFYNQDCRKTLDQHHAANAQVVFQARLGTVAEKAERVQRLAMLLAERTGADQQRAQRAGSLCKADLATLMVNEFPELQGIMGRRYAQIQNEDAEVAQALWEQYLPRFSGDQLPATATGQVLALAEKLDTLTGIFGIGLIPTGSADPFALRRASLGVLRILMNLKTTLSLDVLIDQALQGFSVELDPSTQTRLLEFFVARYRAHYDEQGIAPETLQAVLARESLEPRCVDLRVQALHLFMQHPALIHLAAADRRVRRLLEGHSHEAAEHIDPGLFETEAEHRLHQRIVDLNPQLSALVAEENYQQALERLADLRTEVDGFFEQVMVLVDQGNVRNNRLGLLKQLHHQLSSVADLSLIGR